jgi:DNA-directed RNA polymerase specialized sigma24 family protein
MIDILIRKPDNPAKVFLARYRHLVRQQDALRRAAQDARERTTDLSVRLKPIRVEGGGGAYDRMAEDIARAVDAEQQALGEVQEQIAQALREILAAIESVPSAAQRLVLTLRYVNGKSWAEIGDAVGYENTQVHVFHARGLRHVQQWMEGNGYGQ